MLFQGVCDCLLGGFSLVCQVKPRLNIGPKLGLHPKTGLGAAVFRLEVQWDIACFVPAQCLQRGACVLCIIHKKLGGARVGLQGEEAQGIEGMMLVERKHGLAAHGVHAALLDST